MSNGHLTIESTGARIKLKIKLTNRTLGSRPDIEVKESTLKQRGLRLQATHSPNIKQKLSIPLMLIQFIKLENDKSGFLA